MPKKTNEKVELAGKIMDLENELITSGAIEVDNDDYYGNRFEKLMEMSLYKLQVILLKLEKNAKSN